MVRETLGRWYRDLDPENDPRPMNGLGAPPVLTTDWSDADFERWRARELEACAAFDAWNERHPWVDGLDKTPALGVG